MSVPWRTDLSWLTVEVRAFIDLLWLGQKHHLAMCNASQPPAASKLLPARHGISHREKDKPEDKLHHLFFFSFAGLRQGLHFAASLLFILDVSEHDKRV